MPRIDPIQLLRCLSVLLSSNGGIKSTEEVKRLATLMLRFSKKLVSKCIYIQILKSTETDVLGSFMGAGGWSLTLGWIDESIVAKNWALVQEILELLFLCPVDVERLKTNTFPKRVKGLSKDGNHPGVQFLASKLVERWLRVVKGEVVPPLVATQIPALPSFPDTSVSNDSDIVENHIETTTDDIDTAMTNDIQCLSTEEVDEMPSIESEIKNAQVPPFKICLKNGKQVVSQIEDKILDKETNTSDLEKLSSDSDKPLDEKPSKSEKKSLDSNNQDKKSHSDKSHRSKDKDIDKNKSKDKDSHKSKSSHSSRSSSNKSSSTSRHSSKSRVDSSSSDSKKDTSSRDSSRKQKDKHKSHESKNKTHHNERDKSKESRDRSEKSKDSKELLEKSHSPSISKLGKIPKKSSDSSDVKKDKYSISIEVRKPNDPNRPKTVKMFHSKFRSHGLEEEAKPPPPRGLVKKPTPPVLPGPVSKRPSPTRSTDAPPEKKAKFLESVEKPGAIKLIPAKPKPAFLLESDMFMDALAASATNKKDSRKRKRRTSTSKDSSLNDSSPPTSPTPTATSSSNQPSTPPAIQVSKSSPLRFYQDTLETEEEDKGKLVPVKAPTENLEKIEKKDYTDDSDSLKMKSPLLSPPRSAIIPEDEHVITSETVLEEIKIDETPPFVGLKGVLCVHKKKGPKKSLRWRESNLEEIQYFELDETERVNVTKTFLDMKQMERVHERESFQKARNLPNDDVMEEKTSWRMLIPIDAPFIEYGKNSTEKNIQIAREKSVLQCLYFNKSMIPDAPAEPDTENHATTDPVVIPLEDVSGSNDNVVDYQHTPWPDPKVTPVPIITPGINAPHIFNPLPSFGAGFVNPPKGVPGFPPGPGIMPADWSINGPNMMLPDGMNMPPEMFMGPGPGPGPGPMFPGQMGPGEFPMMDNMNGPMFPPGFPGQMGPIAPNGPGIRSLGPPGPGGPGGPSGPGGPFNFGGNRGGARGPSHRGHWRGKGPNNWNGPPRGGSNHRGTGRLCNHFQKKGFCRQGDKCLFLHPGVNCPF